MQKGEVVTVEPSQLVAGGAALARIDGFPIFATGVFPGDVARVQLIEVKKGYAKADLVEIISPSPLRRASPCPITNECGGCDWTALRLDVQLEAKRQILLESLRRIGKLNPAALPPIRIHPSPLNYRLRSRLHRDENGVGFYAMRSNRVVPLAPECEVVGIETARAPIAGESWEVDGEIITADREITMTVSGFSYRLSTNVFFQVNRHLLATLLKLVEEQAATVKHRRIAVDLYAGVGFFTLPLAPLFERVIAVEGSAESSHYARMNVPPNAQVVEMAVERYASRLPESDFLFLDPPRVGARREVIEAIATRTRERIAFLACDPVAFARDASRLISSGWRLTSLDLIDLFPNTHHVETLGGFERADRVRAENRT